MKFKIIEGGSPHRISKKDASEKFDIFLNKMRDIEKNISIIVQLSNTFNFPILSKKAKDNHQNILNTLSYVKNRKKSILNSIQNSPKLTIITKKR